jgi:hypothetical protein
MTGRRIVTAIVAALLAANGVLRLVDDSLAAQVVGLLGALGLYLLPSPLQANPAGNGPGPSRT